MKVVVKKFDPFDNFWDSNFESSIDAAAKELQDKIYGPKFCKHCNKVRPIIVYERKNTRKSVIAGTTLIVSFLGAKVCSVCMKTINESVKLAEGKDK